MESTSCKENCPFVKQGFCNSYRECPNHIETWWQPGDEGSSPVKLEDCSPKRMVLQQQQMQARFELVSEALVQTRNEYAQLCGYLKNLIELSKQVVFNQDQLQEIKNEESPHLISDSSVPL